MVIECKNCGGKGHVLDAVTTVFSVVGWFTAAFERNNRNGLTREKCSSCDGKGWKRIPDK